MPRWKRPRSWRRAAGASSPTWCQQCFAIHQDNERSLPGARAIASTSMPGWRSSEVPKAQIIGVPRRRDSTVHARTNALAEMIRDHIAANLGIETDDFEYAPLPTGRALGRCISCSVMSKREHRTTQRTFGSIRRGINSDRFGDRRTSNNPPREGRQPWGRVPMAKSQPFKTDLPSSRPSSRKMLGCPDSYP